MVTKQRISNTYRQDVAKLALARELASSRSKVFIAFDVKWDEQNPDLVLEIGMAILDTRHGFLRPNRWPPSTWAIRPRHIVISENIGIRNNRHSRSNKFGFKFGKPYITRLEKAVESIQNTLDNYPEDQVIVVGQFLSQDLTKLESIGIEIEPEIMFDTANLERVHSERVNGRRKGLKEICEEFEIPYYRPDKIGTAGNDAYFAMACFSEMCCI
jgi:hypothetical protein